MKVKELIEVLNLFQPDEEVHIAYNWGDYWNTEVAPKITEVVAGEVKWSEYHNMPKVVPDDCEDGPMDTSCVILLR